MLFGKLMTVRSLALGGLAVATTACGPPGGSDLRLAGLVRATAVVVRAPMAGRLAGAAFEEGQEVRGGQPLASLDPAAIHEEIKSLKARIAVSEARSRTASALMDLELRTAGEAIDSAAERLAIAVRQRDRARRTVEEYDRDPPYIQRRVEAGRIVEERDPFGRLEAEWADARLSFFELQTTASEEALRQAVAVRQSAALRRNGAANSGAEESGELRRRLAEAKRRLEEHTIRAPSDGVVSVQVRAAGELVQPGDPIAVLYDPGDVWVAVSVEESIASGIKDGDAFDAELPGGRRLRAVVENVSAAAGFATQRDVDRLRRDIRAFELKLRLPDGAGVRPGMTAYVRIPE